MLSLEVPHKAVTANGSCMSEAISSCLCSLFDRTKNTHLKIHSLNIGFSPLNCCIGDDPSYIAANLRAAWFALQKQHMFCLEVHLCALITNPTRMLRPDFEALLV